MILALDIIVWRLELVRKPLGCSQVLHDSSTVWEDIGNFNTTDASKRTCMNKLLTLRG